MSRKFAGPSADQKPAPSKETLQDKALLGEEVFLDCAKQYFIRYYPEAVKKTPDRFSKIALLYRTRIRTFRELFEQADFFFEEDISFDPKAVDKYLKDDSARKLLKEWRATLTSKGDFTNPAALEDLLRKSVEQLGVDARMLIHPTRVAISGRTVTPGLFETMAILGRETVLKRLSYVTDHFSDITLKEGTST